MLNLSRQSIAKIVEQEKLYALCALKSPNPARLLAKILFGIFVVFFIFLFVPWQQNIRGNGKVTAFNPANRPQTIETIIAGRIKKWHVQEGEAVKKGDTIITLTEVKEKFLDPALLSRIKEQIQAKESSLLAKDAKAKALSNQIEALDQMMENKLSQGRAKLDAEKVRFENAENQFNRNKKLYEAGNIPLTKFQEFEYKFQGAQADYLNAKIELDRIRAEYLEKISKAESDRSATYSELYESQAELSKLRNEFSNLEIRNDQYQILAPQDGTVVKAIKAGIGETIKEGEAVCTIMPQTESDMAVEMYIKAMDVPLIARGRKARIEFDGWPALQFSGWPSVSVGTFGGTVEVIDFVNSKPGEFRILVVPDPNEPWPKQLRVGSGIKGWVMLNDVPVWYELWRQLNGFPPSLYEEPLDQILKKNMGNEEQK